MPMTGELSDAPGRSYVRPYVRHANDVHSLSRIVLTRILRNLVTFFSTIIIVFFKFNKSPFKGYRLLIFWLCENIRVLHRGGGGGGASVSHEHIPSMQSI